MSCMNLGFRFDECHLMFLSLGVGLGLVTSNARTRLLNSLLLLFLVSESTTFA